jgi:HlyD family secretion protein
VRFVSPQAEFTPPVIYSREERARLVFMVEARPNERAETLHVGQPVDVAAVQP